MDTQTIPLDSITVDPSVWPRERLDRDRAEDFRELYASDGLSALPPLTVVDLGTGYLLADGMHRYGALFVHQSPIALVNVLDNGGRDGRTVAYEEALRSSATTSKPLTKAEKHAAIRRLTVEGGRTDREIGRLVGVSHQTVARVRSASGAGPLDQAENDQEAMASAGSLELSRRLVRGMRRIWDARGVTDLIANRMPRNLADALVDQFGEEEALIWARRMSAWSAAAVTALETR